MQGIHLAQLADARLENAHLSLVVEQPHGKRNSNLRIVTLGGTGDHMVGRENLIEPFLHHRLTIGTRNAHNRYVELVTMTLSQSLQGFQR